MTVPRVSCADLGISTAVKKEEVPIVVTVASSLLGNSEMAGKVVGKFDVMVCGGTLGIFIATALSCRGLRVGVVEKNVLKGVCCFFSFTN